MILERLFKIVDVLAVPGQGLLLTGLGPAGQSLLGRVPSSVVVRWLDGSETRVDVLAYEEGEPVAGKTSYELLVPAHAGLSGRARGGEVFAEQ